MSCTIKDSNLTELLIERENLLKIEQDHQKINGELREEIKKKDKIIDKVAEMLSDSIAFICPNEDYNCDLDCEKRCEVGVEKVCWRMYFEKMIESEEK